jgi:Subtilase family
MKPLTLLKLAAVSLVLSGLALSSASTAGPAAKPAELRNTNVIVILRDQMPNLPGARGAHAARAAALAGAQGPIVSHLQASGASRIHQFQLINAVSATVSPAEREALAAHPLVQAVVPEVTITLRKQVKTETSKTDNGSGGGKPGSQALCGTLEPEALQLMHVADLNPNVPQAQRVRDGHGNFVTGKGVKVAYVADGLDPTVAGFTHTDGTPVFIDYQDFSGDPAGTPTDAGEAFGDASSIAANDTPNGKVLTYDIGQFVITSLGTLPVSPCNIRIRGVAPDASLIGLKVFSAIGTTTNTVFVQAIEYAVLHDDVDVINESFGGNPLPDNDNDPITLADVAAVRAGVTVVASTGDAGYNGTMGSPSTDASVISSGATTQLRLYAQTGYGASFFATNGWINDNLSAFSSGGFSISGPRVPDTVAPGDLGWALCSTNTTLYEACTSLAGKPSPIEIFGGTSESSPLTAGTAALVIQAYRSTHHGADPSPALVKQILMSTANDLGAPPSEQGAGFIDALRAVEAALAVNAPKSTAGTGDGLLNNPTSVSIDAEPNTPQSVTVAITNTGASSQSLEPKLQELGPPIAGATTMVTLSKSDPIFPSPGDLPRYYVLKKFTVPAGAEHLDAAIAWLAPFNGPAVTADLGLIDPNGHDMGYTIPQGASSGYGRFDVNHPTPGVWTAVIWTSGVVQSYFGPVQFSWSAERYVSAGSVSPASFVLAPGATKWVTARFSMPRQPGDSSIAIRFPSSGGGHSEIPIALRTLIPIGVNGGFFSGTLTGGNGRDAIGPTQTFAFDVPAGVNNMSLGLQVLDNFYLLEGLLIDPNGMQLSVQPNVDASGNTAFAMQLNREHPAAGRWRFILLLNYYTSGKQTSLPFTAQIGLDTAQVNATGLPHGGPVSASAPLSVPITITNNGGLSQAYFADARLNAYTTLAFGTAPVCGTSTLPYGCWAAELPTQIRTAQFTSVSTAPITMDAFGDTGYILGFTGAPDLSARSIGPNAVTASLTEPEVPWGEWLMFPTLVGPFGPAGAPTTPVTNTVVAQLRAFDAAVSADSGDLWSDVTFGTNTYNPLVLGPGQTGTINVTIAPSLSQVGSTVHGVIYIDTFNGTVQTGDEAVALPYSYTVTK